MILGCNELGHYQKDCPKYNEDKRKKEESHVVEEMKEPNSEKPTKEVKYLYYD